MAGYPLYRAAPDGIGNERREADARLIAAAPDLLAALRNMVGRIREVCKTRHFSDGRLAEADTAARAAIAKATG